MLSLEKIEQILPGIRTYPIETIFISGFNEPTHDKQLVDKVTAFRQAGFAVYIYTNGSGLKPALTDELLKLGVSGFTFNLSTLDDAEYKQTRGNQDIKRIVPYLDYLLAKVQEQKIEVVLLILGRLDRQHGTNIQMINQQFANPTSAQPQISISPVGDFAGKATEMLPQRPYHKTLQGCVMERQNDWLHFTAEGDAILCSQDYFAKYKMGNVDDTSITQIYHGEKITQWRRWINGTEEAPKDFICRRCLFALTDENYAQRLQNWFCKSCLLPGMLGTEASCQRCTITSMLRVDCG